jgi:AraC-like DNA-binding protein
MSMVFRATDEPVATREDRWRQVIAESIVPMDVRLAEGPTAQDEILAGSLGAVEVIETRTGPGEAHRGPRHIRRSDPGQYQLFVQVRGGGVAMQDGRRVEFRPGDLSLSDLSRPFHCVHPARTATLLRFPRALLPLPAREVARVTTTRIPGDRGTGALLSTLARQLPRHLDDEITDGGARLGTAVLDLLTAVLAGCLDRRRSSLPVDTRDRALVLRARTFIEANLRDPGLTPTAVADAHFISVRYLHKLFRAEETTVADNIRRRRLERCRSDLLDPGLADRPVNAIGARWGLPNPAHFNRAFRSAYGLPPAAFRRTYGERPQAGSGSG